MLINNYIIFTIVSLFVLIIIYLIHQNNKSRENFAVSDEVKAAINEIYQADIDAMRNLANISKSIMNNNDTLILPANLISGKNMNLTGDLSINGNVKFTNKNSNIMEIFPKYMVISWANNTRPKGWALCDGNTYKLNSNGDAVISTEGDVTKTPDLRGRFVLGSGQGDNLTNRNLDNSGGSETHKLTIDETPSHSHFTHYYGDAGSSIGKIKGWQNNLKYREPKIDNGVVTNTAPSYAAVIGGSGSPNYIMQNATDQTANVGLTNSVGNNLPHNNMPPFYVLTYIMKL